MSTTINATVTLSTLNSAQAQVEQGSGCRVEANLLSEAYVGPPGKSAYQSAVEAGFAGTEVEFGASMLRAGSIVVTDDPQLPIGKNDDILYFVTEI